MRRSDYSSEELTKELGGFLTPRPEDGGSHHRLALSLDELEPIAAALTCERVGTGLLCPGCGEEVISGSDYGLFTCVPCGEPWLWLLPPVDFWEPRRP